MPEAELGPSELDVAMPGEADRAALRATLAAAQRDPWLASLIMSRLGAMRERLGALRSRADPDRNRWCKLGINPDDHAGSTG